MIQKSISKIQRDPTQWAVIGLLAIINTIVALNSWFHDPRIGYDAMDHLHYIEALSKLNFVTKEDTPEFFSPPIPYFLPAVLKSWTGINLLQAAKFAQILNFLLSIGTTFYLTKTLMGLSGHRLIPAISLLFLGSLPVYYKTFAFVRGEPYVLFFLAMALYHFAKIFIHKHFEYKQALLFGFAMGASLLSRQWSMFFVLAVGIYASIAWIFHTPLRSKILNAILVSMLTAFVCSGWFYLELSKRYGSMTAFNRQPNSSFSLANQPPGFYFGTGNGHLFKNPVRPNFPNQLIPILYSETWGDYWGYFHIYGKDLRLNGILRMNGYVIEETLAKQPKPAWMKTNYYAGAKYLGRVNLISVFPTLFALLAIAFSVNCIFGKHNSQLLPKGFNLFLLLFGAITVFGYLWFLVMYPNLGKGDTIKASYILYVFPELAIFSSAFLVRIQQWKNKIYWVILLTIIVIWIHNLPAMLTHFPLRPAPWE